MLGCRGRVFVGIGRWGVLVSEDVGSGADEDGADGVLCDGSREPVL